MLTSLPLFELNLRINSVCRNIVPAIKIFAVILLEICAKNREDNQLRRKNMAHVISGECISCGACESTCPVEAISQGDDQFVIDANTCTDCGACLDSCPVDAIAAS
jgi:ferredoxin